ncbi:hypothetical protein ACXET9_10055 [Brachybacterium sp. DNPG3]
MTAPQRKALGDVSEAVGDPVGRAVGEPVGRALGDPVGRSVGDPTAIALEREAHERVALMLDAVVTELRHEQPTLGAFLERRPARVRNSGLLWHGLETMSLVSALLASQGAPGWRSSGLTSLVRAADAAARGQGLLRQDDRLRGGLRQLSWRSPEGDLLEVVIGVCVSVRATSAPYLPEI